MITALKAEIATKNAEQDTLIGNNSQSITSINDRVTNFDTDIDDIKENDLFQDFQISTGLQLLTFLNDEIETIKKSDTIQEFLLDGISQ